jgi:FixJ family two-component response regulator
MPEISGTEVQQALKLAGAQFPVIVVTAQDVPKMRKECMRLGAAAYLCKPLDVSTFVHTVRLNVPAREDQ